DFHSSSAPSHLARSAGSPPCLTTNRPSCLPRPACPSWPSLLAKGECFFRRAYKCSRISYGLLLSLNLEPQLRNRRDLLIRNPSNPGRQNQPLLARRTTNSEIDNSNNLFPGRSLPRLKLRRLLLQLVPQRLLARSIFRWKDLGRKVRGLVHLADLDLSAPIERCALEPFHRFFHGLHLPQPEAADEFLGFGEWAVDYGALLTRKRDALALRTRM